MHAMEKKAQPGRTDSASLVIAAPPDVVYRAFEDAAALISWLPPDNMTGRVLEYDFRAGGRYRIELAYAETAPRGAGKTTSKTDISAGRFLVLEPGQRIVQSVEFESSDPAFAGEMTMTWSFEALAAGTLVTISAENVPAGVTQADHDAGLRSSLAHLARHLARGGRAAEPGF